MPNPHKPANLLIFERFSGNALAEMSQPDWLQLYLRRCFQFEAAYVKSLS